MKHIKIPVKIGGYDAGDYISIQEADGSYNQAMQGMAEIVLAVNARDALVTACESTLESMDIAIGVFGDRIAGSMFKGAFLGVRKQLVTALALAKGDASE